MLPLPSCCSADSAVVVAPDASVERVPAQPAWRSAFCSRPLVRAQLVQLLVLLGDPTLGCTVQSLDVLLECRLLALEQLHLRSARC